jgi:hypothetical protein
MYRSGIEKKKKTNQLGKWFKTTQIAIKIIKIKFKNNLKKSNDHEWNQK